MLSNGGGALLGLRIAQLVVAVAVLGLSAYGVYWLAFDGDEITLFSVSHCLGRIAFCSLLDPSSPLKSRLTYPVNRNNHNRNLLSPRYSHVSHPLQLLGNPWS
jgi:hypothetical protein